MIDRLRKIRNSLGLNQKEFSQKINIGASTLAMLETGQRAIKDIHISQICSVFNVNETWLRTGEGEMFQRSETFSLDEKAARYNLSELENDIMRGYMELPPATRNDLMELFNTIYRKHSETAASIEKTPEEIVEEDVENYRLEKLAELKGVTLSASAKPLGELG